MPHSTTSSASTSHNATCATIGNMQSPLHARRFSATFRLIRYLGLMTLALLVCGTVGTFIAEAVWAQTVTVDMGEQGGSAASQMIRLIMLVTILSLAPGILVMVTSFTRIIVVLSLLRSAIGIQQSPPNSVLISLALFLTLFVMQPYFERAYEDAILPLINEEISEQDAMEKGAAPFHEFMLTQVREQDIEVFAEMAKIDEFESPESIPYRILIPAFMISELRRAFEIGFLVFIPFLIIDMVVASTLMSMGMMMLPPVMISLPFKLIFFVLVDGWALLTSSLVKSFGV